MDIHRGVFGGLLGQYFNNRWLYGQPVMSRVDKILDFHWTADDAITETGKDYISIRWIGHVPPAYDERYEFIVHANGGARLWIDDELLLELSIQVDNQHTVVPTNHTSQSYYRHEKYYESEAADSEPVASESLAESDSASDSASDSELADPGPAISCSKRARAGSIHSSPVNAAMAA